MPKQNNSKEADYLKQFKKLVRVVLGKDEAKLFLEKYTEQWDDRIEKDEPELEDFVLESIEFDNPSCAIILLDDWVNYMNDPQHYETWEKKSSEEKIELINDSYFKIKVHHLQKNMDQYGGRNGVIDILWDSIKEGDKGKYSQALKLLKPLLKFLDNDLFATNDYFQYVSFSTDMEWEIFQYFHHQTKYTARNIEFICPIEKILLQAGRIEYKNKNFPSAEKYLSTALKWNPFSSLSLTLLPLIYSELDRWDDCLSIIIHGLTYAYKPSTLSSLFDSLQVYFHHIGATKDQLCCNYLRLQYASTDKEKKAIARDIQSILRSDIKKNRTRKKCHGLVILPTEENNVRKFPTEQQIRESSTISIDDIRKSSKKYRYPIEINPEIIKIAKSCYHEAIAAQNTEKMDYFKNILSDIENSKEKIKDLGQAARQHKKRCAVN